MTNYGIACGTEQATVKCLNGLFPLRLGKLIFYYVQKLQLQKPVTLQFSFVIMLIDKVIKFEH